MQLHHSDDSAIALETARGIASNLEGPNFQYIELEPSHPGISAHFCDETFEMLQNILAEQLEKHAEGNAQLFGVLDCEDHPKWNDQFEIYKQAFGVPGDRWRHFRVAAASELPEDLTEEYSALIITGSRHSVNADGCTHVWLDALCRLIRQVIELGRTKVVGICFGAQVIAHALGGVVGGVDGLGFILGSEEIALNDKSSILGGELPASFELVESHGEHVLQLPPNAYCLASSRFCENEIYGICSEGGLAVLGCQAHPEFSGQIVADRILPAIVSKGIRIQQGAEESRRSLLDSRRLEADSDRMRGILRNFIHHRVLI